jgi:branched-chain amino acid transport system ATP-binding protein
MVRDMKATSEVKLRVEDLHLRFGGVEALRGISFEVREGEILAIIGPNGAGKTCILNCINNFYHAQKGEIYFEGRRITKLRSDAIARLGISRTFQNVQLYTGLTTLENLMAARYLLFKSNWVEEAIYYGKAHREEIKHRRVVEGVIDLLHLTPYRKTRVEVLSYGLRKRIDLGRALAQEPKLLLLDEPMAGVDATEKRTMARFILDVQERRGIAIVLIEHDMNVVMDIVDRAIVVDFGRQIAEGPPERIMHDPAVIKAYLGEEVLV